MCPGINESGGRLKTGGGPGGFTLRYLEAGGSLIVSKNQTLARHLMSLGKANTRISFLKLCFAEERTKFDRISIAPSRKKNWCYAHVMLRTKSMIIDVKDDLKDVSLLTDCRLSGLLQILRCCSTLRNSENAFCFSLTGTTTPRILFAARILIILFSTSNWNFLNMVVVFQNLLPNLFIPVSVKFYQNPMKMFEEWAAKTMLSQLHLLFLISTICLL